MTNLAGENFVKSGNLGGRLAVFFKLRPALEPQHRHLQNMTQKLDNYKLTWYMHEICMHSMGAKIEFDRLASTLAAPDMRQSRLVWFHLTSFLSHSAMISKYLSPISKCEIAILRKQALRVCLRVDGDSEVLQRDARDNIEHFDERLDNWVDGDNQNILEIVLPDHASYDYLRFVEKRVKRVLIQDVMVFISEKKDKSQFQLCLNPLNDEVIRIGIEAEKWINDKSAYHFVFPR